MSRLGRVPPSFGRDVIDRKACFLSLLAQAAVWLLELRVSRTFLWQLRSQLFRPWIPNSRRHQHFRSSLGAFCLFELRSFLDISIHFTAHLFSPWIPSSMRCQSRKGPPTFPWCQKVGAPIRSNSAVCVRQYPAGEGLHPAETRSARVSRPRRSVDRRSPGDMPTVGDRETVGRRGRAGQETTARTSATVLATPSRFMATDHWPLFPLTSFREPGTPRP